MDGVIERIDQVGKARDQLSVNLAEKIEKGNKLLRAENLTEAEIDDFLADLVAFDSQYSEKTKKTSYSVEVAFSKREFNEKTKKWGLVKVTKEISINEEVVKKVFGPKR